MVVGIGGSVLHPGVPVGWEKRQEGDGSIVTFWTLGRVSRSTQRSGMKKLRMACWRLAATVIDALAATSSDPHPPRFQRHHGAT